MHGIKNDNVKTVKKKMCVISALKSGVILTYRHAGKSITKLKRGHIMSVNNRNRNDIIIVA